MKEEFFYYNYHFNTFKLSDYHHTDASKGANMNFVALMLKGKVKIASKKETLEINKGQVFYIPKGLPYHSYWFGSPEIEFISIGYHELNTCENNSYKLQIVNCDEELVNAIKSIKTNGAMVDSATLSSFYRMISLIIPLLTSNDSKEKTIIENAKQLIQNNPYITTKDLAAGCLISEPYLYLLFKRLEGVTPNDYRQITLCNKAKELLCTTDKSVEEISRELNFSSSIYFRKIIKKHLGMTPREIRKISGI